MEGLSFGAIIKRNSSFRFLLQMPNLVPRVLRPFDQWVVARRDSEELEFYYRRISRVKKMQGFTGQSKNLNFFEVPIVSSGIHLLTKKPEDSGYEISTSVS